MKAPLPAIALSGLLALWTSAACADYALALAVDHAGKQVTRQVSNCVYGMRCRITELNLSIVVFVDGPTQKNARVHIHGLNPCCFFTDGSDVATIDRSKTLNVLDIYEGVRRRRNELRYNSRVGSVFIAISPGIDTRWRGAERQL
jgi:hypothetical protein